MDLKHIPTLEEVKEMQHRWDEHFPSMPVRTMINLHSFLEVAEETKKAMAATTA